MLVELGVVEQRYKAVSEVLFDGVSVTEVALRAGVTRQTVHAWLRRYAASGMAGLVDRSCRPDSCPHQTPSELEAAVITMRLGHPSWGPRRILVELHRAGTDPLPGRSTIYRILVRNGLVDPQRRRRRREDYKRWERSRSMELWQMDIMGRVVLADGSECSVVTGIDDHSRFCVAATLVARATARPVCAALVSAMRTHGVPDAVLTDNGKVFTGRFGLAKTEVLFDRICRENGVRHLLTAPYSPTTTGKIERLHKTMRAEFFNAARFESIEATQDALDAWVAHYNTERPHQGIGDVPPAQRFALARPVPVVIDSPPMTVKTAPAPATVIPPAVRQVARDGHISLASHRYPVGRWLAGENVEIVCGDVLVEIFHRGVLIVSHVARHKPGTNISKRKQAGPRPRKVRLRPGITAAAVTRLVDTGGYVSFAGHTYRAGRDYARQNVQIGVVDDERVEITLNGLTIKTHPILHDRRKEYGAFATPTGRPRKPKDVA